MSEHDFYFVLCLSTNQISRAPRTEHDGVLRHGRYARGGSDTRDYRSQPAAARSTDARETRPRTTPTCRARRIRLTSCQTARASAHRAGHLDRPDTKARACSWRHANAQALGDGTEQRVYLYPRKAKLFAKHMFPAGACFPCPGCLRFFLPFCGERAQQLTILFSLFDANLKNTVSLRRSMEPNDG